MIKTNDLATVLAKKNYYILRNINRKVYYDLKITIDYFKNVLKQIDQDDVLYVHYGNIIADKTTGNLIISISIYEE